MISCLCLSKAAKTLGGAQTHPCCLTESPIFNYLHLHDSFKKHVKIPPLMHFSKVWKLSGLEKMNIIG